MVKYPFAKRYSTVKGSVGSNPTSSAYASIVQRIEHVATDYKMWVRFLLDAQGGFMKYLDKPPRKPIGRIVPKRHREDFWIRALLILGTLGVLIVISQFLK